MPPSTLLQAVGEETTARTPTGFYWPTGTNVLGEYSGWFSDGCSWSGNNSYTEGEYHIGHDIEADEGSFVYPIADGQVIHISENGWGAGNVGVLAEHKLDDGSSFVAVYGHVRTEKKRSDQLEDGVPFATIGAFDPPHLHFGIRPGTSITAPYGFMICPDISPITDTNNFVDPIEWITTRIPGPFLLSGTVAVATITNTPTQTPPAPVPTPTRRPTPTSPSLTIQNCVQGGQTGLIAFIREGNIWIIGEDGSCKRQLTQAGNYTYPSISPDGSKIAFIQHLKTDSDKDAYLLGQLDLRTLQESVLVDIEATPFVLLGNFYEYGIPKWSPDGNYLYYRASDGRASGAEVRKLDLRSFRSIVLGHNTWMGDVDRGIDIDPLEAKIAYASYSIGAPGGDELAIADENGNFLKTLVTMTDNVGVGFVCWTQDGQALIFAKSSNPSQLSDISLEWIDMNGGNNRTILLGLQRYPNGIACSPTEQEIIYEKGSSLFIFDYLHSSEQYLTSGTQPSWGKPSSVSNSSSEFGTISGTRCYPSTFLPSMTIYARNVDTQVTFAFHLPFGGACSEEQTNCQVYPNFSIAVPQGNYLLFSWTDDDPLHSLGGVASCYDNPSWKSCSGTRSDDHTPIVVSVEPGKIVRDVAICDYYTDQIPPAKIPGMEPIFLSTETTTTCEVDSDFVSDVTIPDNTEIRGGQRFTKTWRLRNSGTCDWTADYQLIFLSGDQMNGAPRNGLNRTVLSGETIDISVEMVAPEGPGTYRGQWQLASPTGELFGTKPYVQIVVP